MAVVSTITGGVGFIVKVGSHLYKFLNWTSGTASLSAYLIDQNTMTETTHAARGGASVVEGFIGGVVGGQFGKEYAETLFWPVYAGFLVLDGLNLYFSLTTPVDGVSPYNT